MSGNFQRARSNSIKLKSVRKIEDTDSKINSSRKIIHIKPYDKVYCHEEGDQTYRRFINSLKGQDRIEFFKDIAHLKTPPNKSGSKIQKKYLLLAHTSRASYLMNSLKRERKNDAIQFMLLGLDHPHKEVMDKKVVLATDNPFKIVQFLQNNGFHFEKNNSQREIDVFAPSSSALVLNSPLDQRKPSQIQKYDPPSFNNPFGFVNHYSQVEGNILTSQLNPDVGSGIPMTIQEQSNISNLRSAKSNLRGPEIQNQEPKKKQIKKWVVNLGPKGLFQTTMENPKNQLRNSQRPLNQSNSSINGQNSKIVKVYRSKIVKNNSSKLNQSQSHQEQPLEYIISPPNQNFEKIQNKIEKTSPKEAQISYKPDNQSNSAKNSVHDYHSSEADSQHKDNVSVKIQSRVNISGQESSSQYEDKQENKCYYGQYRKSNEQIPNIPLQVKAPKIKPHPQHNQQNSENVRSLKLTHTSIPVEYVIIERQESNRNRNPNNIDNSQVKINDEEIKYPKHRINETSYIEDQNNEYIEIPHQLNSLANCSRNNSVRETDKYFIEMPQQIHSRVETSKQQKKIINGIQQKQVRSSHHPQERVYYDQQSKGSYHPQSKEPYQEYVRGTEYNQDRYDEKDHERQYDREQPIFYRKESSRVIYRDSESNYINDRAPPNSKSVLSRAPQQDEQYNNNDVFSINDKVYNLQEYDKMIDSLGRTVYVKRTVERIIDNTIPSDDKFRKTFNTTSELPSKVDPKANSRTIENSTRHVQPIPLSDYMELKRVEADSMDRNRSKYDGGQTYQPEVKVQTRLSSSRNKPKQTYKTNSHFSNTARQGESISYKYSTKPQYTYESYHPKDKQYKRVVEVVENSKQHSRQPAQRYKQFKHDPSNQEVAYKRHYQTSYISQQPRQYPNEKYTYKQQQPQYMPKQQVRYANRYKQPHHVDQPQPKYYVKPYQHKYVEQVDQPKYLQRKQIVYVDRYQPQYIDRRQPHYRHQSQYVDKHDPNYTDRHQKHYVDRHQPHSAKKKSYHHSHQQYKNHQGNNVRHQYQYLDKNLRHKDESYDTRLVPQNSLKSSRRKKHYDSKAYDYAHESNPYYRRQNSQYANYKDDDQQHRQMQHRSQQGNQWGQHSSTHSNTQHNPHYNTFHNQPDTSSEYNSLTRSKVKKTKEDKYNGNANVSSQSEQERISITKNVLGDSFKSYRVPEQHIYYHTSHLNLDQVVNAEFPDRFLCLSYQDLEHLRQLVETDTMIKYLVLNGDVEYNDIDVGKFKKIYMLSEQYRVIPRVIGISSLEQFCELLRTL